VGTAPDLCVIVLAGGSGSRIGGADKPMRLVAGQTMVSRVLAAGADARIRVVVGPPGLPVPAGVAQVWESPAGGGPVAAVAAGLRAVGAEDDGVPRQVAVLACDLPLLTSTAVGDLRERLDRTGADVAVYRDRQGRRQLLCGLWWEPVLRAVLPDEPTGAPMRRLFDGLHVAELEHTGGGPPPWYDCDTPDELAQAQRWAGAAEPGTDGEEAP
jgi:molybdopterin-guanine dinucleotide biosynthesis protein A